MRLILALIVVLGVAVVLATNVFRPAPAGERLAGVRVQVAGYTLDDLPNDRQRLHLTVTLVSSRTIDECVAFTLDQPFGGRQLKPASGVCPRPRGGATNVALLFDLTSSDVQFPSHTLVWGVPGGRCGIVLELFGVCVVDQAGTVDFELPSRQILPTFGPLGSFGLGG
jgi:hypothetical protein